MSRFGNILFAIIGIWTAGLFAVFLLPHPFYAIRGFGSLLSLLLNIAVFILCVVAYLIEKNKVQALLALLLVTFVSFVIITMSGEWGAFAYFYLNKSSYEKTVRDLSAANSAERGKICGDRCLIISDSPLRVAFHYSQGLVGWDDIVYDPSGEVNSKEREKLKKMATYLYGAEHISGDWYLGHFGD